MVNPNRKYILFLLFVFLLSGCSIDFTGFFYSTDLDTRWAARNTFNFLSLADRNLSLGNEYSFIVLTDTHIYNGDVYGLEKLSGVIKNNGKIKFVVFAGDITQNGNRGDIEKFIEIAKTFDVPCYPVIGNHDLYFQNWNAWEELIGSTCYRIDCGSSTLLILDSANEYLGAKQIDWLDNEINKANGRVFVFSHANLFLDSSVEVVHLSDTRERAKFISILKKRCDILFTGHSHMRLITELNGYKNINIEDFKSNSVYCLVHVSKNDIRYEFLKL